MQNFQQHVDDIRDVIQNPKLADPALVRETAARYAEACVEVNQRLRSVAQLLRKNLRSEAIQLVEEEPNLLDVFGVVNFPELGAWNSALVLWDLDPPPALLSEIAIEIEEAYAIHVPQEGLLRQHRLLALARAPLPARIAVLRRLIAKEEKADAWEADLRLLEEARLKEIGQEVNAAVRDNDLRSLGACRDELMASDWTVPPPVALRKRAERLCQEALKREALGALERLEPTLHEAHMAMDEDRGIGLAHEWSKAAALAGLPDDHGLAARAAPALAWAHGCDDRRQREELRQMAVLALEHALDEGARAEELTRLFNEATAFDTPPPEETTHRYRERLEADHQTAARRNRLVVAAVVGMVALVAGASVFLIRERLQQRAIRVAADTLASLNQAGQFDAAAERYQTLLAENPTVAADATVQEQHAATLAANARLRRESEDFEVHAAVLADWSPPAPFPQESYEAALSLATTAAEESAVRQHKDRRDSWQAGLVTDETRALAAAVDEQKSRLNSLEAELNRPTPDFDRLPARVREVSEALRDAINRYPNASGLARQAAQVAESRATDINTKLLRKQKLVAAVRDVTGAVGDWEGFGQRLAEYFKLRPQGAALLALRDQELLWWEGLQEWDAFLAARFNGTTPTPAAAETIVAEGEALAKKHPDSPLAEEYQRRKAYIESIANRGSGPIQSELQKLSRQLRQDPYLANLFLVETQSGARYYCEKDPAVDGKMVKFSYYLSNQGGKKGRSIAVSEVKYHGLAPVARFVRDARTLLESIEEDSQVWDSRFAALVWKLGEANEVEPIVRARILQDVVRLAVEGSSVFRTTNAAFIDDLAQASVSGQDWLKPDDALVTADRRSAQQELRAARWPPRDQLKRGLDQARELLSPPAKRYRWVGWMQRRDDESWRFHGETSGLPAADLIVLAEPQAGQPVQVQTIGRIEQGQPSLSASGVRFADGRAVFAEIPRPEKRR
ncbi:MAG: hypothetical protein AAGJ46_05220 [Planctomycetota bacterium]